MRFNLITKLATSLLCISSFHSYANVVNIPPSDIPFSWCETGRASTSGFAFIHAKGPTHQLVNTSAQFRGDSNNTHVFEDVNFYKSGILYRTDTSDIQGNAYANIAFNSKGRFAVSAVISGNACSYTQVQVHGAPNITNTTLSGGGTLTTTLKGNVDASSKGAGKKYITYTYRNVDFNITETFKVTSSAYTTTTKFHPRYNGEYRVSVSMSDGTFSDGTVLGLTRYSGGSDCPPGQDGNCRDPF